MRVSLSSVAGVSAAALVAGLLSGTVPALVGAASPAAALPSSAPVDGIETVGPIPTVPSSAGNQWPGVPPQVAVLPSGSVIEGDYPLVYAKALKEFASLPYRVVDLTKPNNPVVAEGTMVNGWAQVDKRLAAGGLYQVDVQADTRWITAGRFNVGVRGATGGPALDSGNLSVSTVTGSVASGWASRVLPSPSTGVNVGLNWSSGAPTSPGLPTGWQLMASTGSMWKSLAENGAQVNAVDVPAAPQASRTPGESTATVSFGYPQSKLHDVRQILVAEKVPGGEWRVVKRTDTSFADPAVDVKVPVPVTGRVLVRVGLDVGDTVVWGDSARVGAAPLVGDPSRATDGRLAASGRQGSVTAGILPDVVTLTGWDGSHLDFVRNPLGVYEQVGPAQGMRNSVTSVSPGVWEFTDTQGITTRFRSGRAVAVAAPKRQLSEMTWDAKGRLTKVANDIGASISLGYSDTVACPDWTAYGFVPAPAGDLCTITYPDGTRSEVGYVMAGDEAQIALVKDPGNNGATWGWDSRGRLVSTRAALVSQVATMDRSAASAVDSVSYDSKGRAFRVTAQPATVGGSSLSQNISFPAITAAGVRAFMNDPSLDNAIAGKVTTSGAPGYSVFTTSYFDPHTLAPVRVTDSAGRSIARDPQSNNGLQRVSRDSANRVTKYTYDALGLVTKTEGPVTSGTGPVQESKYDTEYIGGKDVALTGLRALTYEKAQFTGAAKGEFWRSAYSRSALSATWSGRSAQFSAQATGVWTPSEDDDKAGSQDGWQFDVTMSGGTTATVLIGTTPCEGNPCVIKNLPTGAKSVTIEISNAGSSGWVDVQAAPVGQKLVPVDDRTVSPGYALTTMASNNDVAAGMRQSNQTRYVFADPASAKPSKIISSNGSVLSFSNASDDSSVVTLPGGKTISSNSWKLGELARVPAVCGAATYKQLGQTKTVTRQDGTTVTSYYDDWSRQVAAVITAGGTTQTQCFALTDSGDPVETSLYDTNGQLIEKTTSVYAVGGDPRVTGTIVTHGPAAPVAPDTSVNATLRVDLSGRPVSSTDPSGVVTTTEYDRGGQVSKVTTTPPAEANAAPLVFEYTYGAADGDLRTVKVNGDLAATLTYDQATGALQSIRYADGVTRSVTRRADGRPGSVTVVTPDPRFTKLIDRADASDYGRILGSQLTVVGTQSGSESRSYRYDSAARLTRAAIVGTGSLTSATYTYGFDATQDASCGSTYSGAGLDNLRTSGTRNGTAYRTCYDAQGRPVSTTDSMVTGGSGTSNITYDALGRVTGVSGNRSLSLTWGSGTQLAVLAESGPANSDPVTTTLNTFEGGTYEKTVTDNSGTNTVRYAGPFQFEVTGGVITGTTSVNYGLPGGAIVRTAPGQTATLTVAGLDGSALVSVAAPTLAMGLSANGVPTRLEPRFGPFGEALVTPAAVGNILPQFGWQAGSGQETLSGTSSVTMMGDRPYLPALGNFLAPDPQIMSGLNMYGYTDGDPINASDATGNMTEDDFSTVLLSAGAGAAILGGMSFMGGKMMILRSFLRAETPQAVLRWPGRTVSTIGAIAFAAGVGAVGYGTYLKVKSSMSESSAILTAVGASLAAVAGTYLVTAAALAVGMKIAQKVVAKRRVVRAASDGSVVGAPEAKSLDWVFIATLGKKTRAKKAVGVEGRSGSVQELQDILERGSTEIPNSQRSFITIPEENAGLIRDTVIEIEKPMTQVFIKPQQQSSSLAHNTIKTDSSFDKSSKSLRDSQVITAFQQFLLQQLKQ